MYLFVDSESKRKMQEEVKRYNTSFLAHIACYDSYYIGTYIHYLRLEEFYRSHTTMINRILGGVYSVLRRRIGLRTGFNIPPFTCGYGILISHIGNIIINGKARIGKNVHLQPGVVVGKTTHDAFPVIGDNCYLCLGAKVFGAVKVGNNVMVAPNAVVTKDVDSNTIVGGVPAKFIKYRN